MFRALIPLILLLLGGCSNAGVPDSQAPPSMQSPTASDSSPSTGEPEEPEEPDEPEEPEEPDEPAVFKASVQPIGPALRQRMHFSHRSDCPVPLAKLRYLQMSFVGFDGRVRLGEMVVHRDHAEEVIGVFKELYDAEWPIRRMRLVDDYQGDDDRSMAANNTSAYNCRRVAGSDSWSDHAYGAAIDINPVQNPYVNGGSIVPSAGRRFASIDRATNAPVSKGVIKAADIVVESFEKIGWEWGGDWVSSKDYQHFSASGG